MATSVDAVRDVNALPAAIGRFPVVRCIGRGGQGVVYLARDPDLDRQVAIKTLSRRGHYQTRLINEARNVARLQHPNIVALYEIGTHQGSPFLVYRYAEGMSLKELLGRQQPVPAARAIRIIAPALDAIGYAHSAGIIHRDLSPSNILIDKDDQPFILDFGVSGLIGLSATSGDIVGTVNYMAPENLSGGEVGPGADIFSLSVILHELLTGKPLFAANSHMAVMYKIVNEKILPPSAYNTEVDPKLDAIVMLGLEKDTARRYHDAGEMRTALLNFLNPAEEPRDLDAGDGGGAIEFLLRKMRRKPDFPAISEHITEINQKASSSMQTHRNDLVNVILKDYALTTKLLRLVNSAVFRQYSGTPITTISRAVLILGFEQVRMAALNIALFDHLKNAEQADEMKNSLLGSFLSAMIAKEIGGRQRHINVEEAFLVSLFLRLGKLLTIYYFPEEFREIERQMATQGHSEATAAKAVLGATYPEVGMAIAREWKLPEVVIRGMRGATDSVTAARSPEDLMIQIATFSNEVAEVAARGGDNLQRDLAEVTQRYKRVLNSSDDDIKKVIASSLEKVVDHAELLNINVRSSCLCTVIEQVTGRKPEAEPQPTPGISTPAAGEITEGPPANVAETGAGGAAASEADRRLLLINSIAEIATTLLDDYDLNAVLVMILETLYRGMGFAHVVMLIRDARNNLMQARFGFGPGIDAILPRFRFGISTDNDIFNEAARAGREFVVLNVDSDEYRTRVPQWCRQLTAPAAVVLLPILVNKACISLIYADSQDAKARISSEELKLFATLTKQAALAIQQKSARR